MSSNRGNGEMYSFIHVMGYFVAIILLGKCLYPDLTLTIAQADRQSMITHFLIKKREMFIYSKLSKYRYKLEKEMHQIPKRAILSDIRDGFSFMCFVVFSCCSTSFLRTHLVPSIHHSVLLVSRPDKYIPPCHTLLTILIESKFSVPEVTLRFYSTSLFCK